MFFLFFNASDLRDKSLLLAYKQMSGKLGC